jgi:hypothetical protein
VIGLAKELGDDAGSCFLDFDFRRERAVGGIESDLFDGFDLRRRPAALLRFRQVETGDL